MVRPKDMSELELNAYYKAAEKASSDVTSQLRSQDIDGPFGHVLLTMALAKWLATHHHVGNLENDDLEGTLKKTTEHLIGFTREYAAGLK